MIVVGSRVACTPCSCHFHGTGEYSVPDRVMGLDWTNLFVVSNVPRVFPGGILSSHPQGRSWLWIVLPRESSLGLNWVVQAIEPDITFAAGGEHLANHSWDPGRLGMRFLRSSHLHSLLHAALLPDVSDFSRGVGGGLQDNFNAAEGERILFSGVFPTRGFSR